jgi:hypothetical protein
MLKQYADLILWVSILGTVLTGYLIFLVVKLSNAVNNLKEINLLLTRENTALNKENNSWRINNKSWRGKC